MNAEKIIKERPITEEETRHFHRVVRKTIERLQREESRFNIDYNSEVVYKPQKDSPPITGVIFRLLVERDTPRIVEGEVMHLQMDVIEALEPIKKCYAAIYKLKIHTEYIYNIGEDGTPFAGVLLKIQLLLKDQQS